MLRLTLWNDAETAQHTIELYDHVPVNLTYQFTDVADINKSVGSYSQTFRIPATKQNTDFFGAIYDPNIFTSSGGLINGNYNIKRRVRAELSFNSVPLMKGYIQLKAIYLQKEHFADIELVFLGEALDMKTTIGEAMLSDLDTSAIDHELNYNNVLDSWVNFLSGNVRYGMIDKGQNWDFDNIATSAITSPFIVWQGDLTPYARVKWIIDQILTEAGYTYDSAFFDSTDFLDIYLPAYNGAKAPVSDDTEPESQTAAVGLATGFVLTSYYVLVPFLDNVQGGWDFSSNWDNTTHSFTAPYPCHLVFTLSRRATPTSNLRFKIYLNGGEIRYYESWGQTTETLTLLAGDVLTFKAKREVTGSINTLHSGPIGGDNTWFRIDSISEPLMLQDVDMSANFPKIKQIDFLTGLQKMFNLVFVPDKSKPKHLLIEPFNDYTSTGVAKDWSSKIDYTKNIVIRPTADIQKKEYDWTSAKGQDFINVLVQQSANRVYGRYRVTDPENDFATGEQVITTPFAPYLMSHIPNAPIVIHRCIDKDGNGIKTPKPRLAYWNGLTSDYGGWRLNNDIGSASLPLEIPNFSNYSAVAPTIGDKDLNFGYEPAFMYMEAHPLHTLYYKHWMNYVNELYSPEARLLTAYVKLTRADIQDFEFSDKIYIKDSYYRVLKISNFDATIGQSVQVELIKVLADISDCQFTPSFVGGTGAIRFTGGDPIEYGNQTCCERYGYIWRPRISRCFPNSQLPQPE